MNNIDILEDLLSTQKQYIEDKDYQKEHNINEKAIDYLKRWAKAIETLIAENKELKEENLHWKGQYHLLSRKIDVIQKSKVVEELKKAISEEIDTSKAMFEGDFINGYIYALQSLLGKE